MAQRKNTDGFTVRYTLHGRPANAPTPNLALYRLSRSGKVVEKLAVSRENTLEIPEKVLKSEGHVALGPDVESLTMLDPFTVTKHRITEIREIWQKEGKIDISPAQWHLWPLEWAFVSGKVRLCRYWWLPPITEIFQPIFTAHSEASFEKLSTYPVNLVKKVPEAVIIDSIIWPWYRCRPLCNGTVEVYEVTTCCPTIDWRDILEGLLDRLREIPIPIPEPDPIIPDLPPGPGADPAPFERGMLRQLKTVASRLENVREPLMVSERVLNDAKALSSFTDEADAQAYIEARPYLSIFGCTKTVKYVGQASINPDGTFSKFYWKTPHFTPFWQHCTTAYAYKVKQVINGTPTVVYDGLALGEYFDADEVADIKVFHPQAQTDCPPDPPFHLDTPFVALEFIGGTPLHYLNSPAQTSENALGSWQDNYGLVEFSGLQNCPWGGTLAFKLYFDEDMKGLGATHYRMKLIPLNDSGSVIGSEITLTTPISWRRRLTPDSIDYAVESLGPKPTSEVGGLEGLYQIPYFADRWVLSDPGAYHMYHDTTQNPNGRYMLVLELFHVDSSGARRVVPNGAATMSDDLQRGFLFAHWTNPHGSPDEYTELAFGKLLHVLWVNNTKVKGDIIDLRRDGVRNTDECQFLTGFDTTDFSVGFEAYHPHDSVLSGMSLAGNKSFIRSYYLQWQRGMSGTWHTIQNSSTPVPAAIPPAASTAVDFEDMLGTHSKCSFSVELYVYAKHTNGSHFLTGYDARDNVSFALESIGPAPM